MITSKTERQRDKSELCVIWFRQDASRVSGAIPTADIPAAGLRSVVVELPTDGGGLWLSYPLMVVGCD